MKFLKRIQNFLLKSTTNTQKYKLRCILKYISICTVCVLKGGKNSRGIRVSSYDPDDSAHQQQQPQNYAATVQQQQPPIQQQQSYNVQSQQTIQAPTLGSSKKFSQKVSTISQNYNEKSMLLSSDEEYQ